MKLNILLFFLFTSIISFAQKGIVSGVILDKEFNNEPLAFVSVAIKGTSIGLSTDEKGYYQIALLPGNYILIVTYLGYENKETPFTIKADEKKTINLTLQSNSILLKNTVIESTLSKESEGTLLLGQRQAIEIKQSIGSQELSRKGVSDISEGLTKITGITKVDGRGLFIRGLEDRYNNLLISNLQTPSNSPFKKIIPLDLFPSDIVGVLTVYKTFNPDISGDFSGATINVEFPEPKNITKLSAGFGFTTNHNLKKFLISDDVNSTQGYFGLIGNTRSSLTTFGNTPSGKILSPAEYENIYGQKSWDVNEAISPLNSSIGFFHSQKISLKKEQDFSYLISLNFDNKYTINEGVDRTFNLGQGNYDNNLYNTQYLYQTTFSGLLGLKYKNDRLSILVNSLLLKATESKIQDQLGYTNSLANQTNNLIRLNQLEETSYWNNQLIGNYKITSDGKHQLKAGSSFIKTSFQQPDRKFIIGTKENNEAINMSYGGNNLNRQYLDVKGNYYFSSFLEYHLNFGKQENLNKLTVGHQSFLNDMQSSYRFFSSKKNIAKNYTTNLNTLSEPINDDIYNGIIYVQEESNGDYKVKLHHLVNAAYLNLFLNFSKKWQFNTGLRVENSSLEIKYREQGDPFGSPFRLKNENQIVFLPSINAKYILNEKNNLRLSFSKTITRPVAMELLPINYINADATSESGNPNLKNSDNYNVDFKYELFPNNKELLAIGVFGKLINNPIERVFKTTANSGGQITTFKNSEQALLYGAEIELLFQLSSINESLSNFSIGFNTSLMDTDVKIDLNQQGNELENYSNRALQGASNWLINADLKYHFKINENWKNTMTLIYNSYGDRIFAVGSSGIDHIYEKSFNKLDFVWLNTFSKKVELKIAVDNILNPSYKKELGNNSILNITEESLVLKEFKKGVGFSLSIGYTF